MSFFNVLTLFGGLAMFLYGMRLMGDGLKESSSGTLKKAMEMVTNNPVKAFLLGLGVTAIIQSSTATIVITAGLVAAGIITFKQSLGIVIGANVGTTVTGQIIRLLDLSSSAGWLELFKPSSLAPIALIIGIILIMSDRFKNARVIGNIAIGFGILFSGLLNMTAAVDSLSETGIFESMFSSLGNNPLLGYLTGALVAFILQSSSATIGILQALSSAGGLTFNAVYAVIAGVFLGDCVTTGIVCSIGARADSKRVGAFNIMYNLAKTILVFVGIYIFRKTGLLDSIWFEPVNSGRIANANTVFNLASALILLPAVSLFEKASYQIVKDDHVALGPNAVDLALEGAVKAVRIHFLILYKLVLGHEGAENIGRIEEILHTVLFCAAGRPGSGRNGEFNLRMEAQKVVHYGALPASGRGRKDEDFAGHRQSFCVIIQI